MSVGGLQVLVDLRINVRLVGGHVRRFLGECPLLGVCVLDRVALLCQTLGEENNFSFCYKFGN